jgi:hypothetical protein
MVSVLVRSLPPGPAAPHAAVTVPAGAGLGTGG